MLTNLVSNAVKYSRLGTLVEVDAERAADGGVDVRVRDHGIGIPAEEQAHVFEPFARAESARRTPGVGLGLSVVQRIIAAHGGKLALHSAAGAGTVVTIHLPAAA